VLPIPSVVSGAQVKRLGTVCGPVCFVVELGRVPYNLP
jgi:hypothetical protein